LAICINSRRGAIPGEDFRYARDLAFIEMKPTLWKQLTPEDIEELHRASKKGIETYYARLNP
jgi:hypothetical protein